MVQVSGLGIQATLRDVGRGDALVARLELEFHGELLQFVADDGAVGHPQRQAAADLVVEGEQVEFPAELPVVAFLGKLERRHGVVEGFLVGERPSVDARHHHVVGVATPIGAGNAPQLEGVAGDVPGRVDVRAFAHVEERAVAVEGQALQGVPLDQFLGVLALVGFAHLLESGEGLGDGHVLLVEALPLLENPAHAPLEFREVGLGERLAQDEVVVEAVVDGRAEAEGRALAHFEHRLGHDVGEAVPEPIELLVRTGFRWVWHWDGSLSPLSIL